MNQFCKVCGEPAAGFHFGAFTCEGCKSFFGRSYNNLSSINECKNNGKCIIDKKNRTTCKACRLRKCYTVGMSKGGSRYGRRSNWFKIHCLLQEQQQQASEAAEKVTVHPSSAAYESMAAVAAAAQQHMQRNSQLIAAQRMGSFLGYPSLLPEVLKSCSAFASGEPMGCHAPGSDSANGLPFISLMNALPMAGAPPVPANFMFNGYHSGLTSFNASCDTGYHSESLPHRRSIDSIASSDSLHCHSPAANKGLLVFPDGCPSPELCVADENPAIIVSACHKIHTPKAVRAIPKELSASAMLSEYPDSTQTAPSPNDCAHIHTLSPISQCSLDTTTTTAAAPITTTTTATASSILPTTDISNSASAVIEQDLPMDLSVRSPSASSDTAGSCEIRSKSSNEDTLAYCQQNLRRKFSQFQNDQEPDNDDDDDDDDVDAAAAAASANNASVKRRIVAAAGNNVVVGHGYSAAVTSLQSIFVCV